MLNDKFSSVDRIIFMSFADSKYAPMLKRIKTEASDSHFFSEVRIFSERDFEEDYKRKYKERFKQRGFGYWMWKSYMVRRVLKEMNDNDILVYSDSGCTINANAKKRFEDYISHVKQVQSGILVFAQMKLLESAYTKADLFAYAGCMNEPSITSTPQFLGGIFLIRKCQQSVEFVEKWYDLSHNHFSLITDEPSKINNFPDFIEHRHDQSALSVLVKPYKPYIIDDRETYTTGSFHEELALFPFWATRNRKCSWGYLKKDGLKRRFHKLLNIFK